MLVSRQRRNLPGLQSVVVLVLCMSFWSGAAKNVFAADRQLGDRTLPEATIMPRLTRLPIIDGYVCGLPDFTASKGHLYQT